MFSEAVFRSWLLFLVLFAGTASATKTIQSKVRPRIPEPGSDARLTGNLAPRVFFGRRAENAGCRRELADARGTFAARRKALETAVAGGDKAAIDAAEAAVSAARAPFLAAMDRCGECAVREVEMWIVSTGPAREIWYVSDGSCQLDLDAAGSRAAFGRMRDSLQRLKRYPQRYPGGFSHVLEFLSVDNDSGEPRPEMDLVETSPFYTFVSVMGPEVFGVPTASSYYIRNDVAPKADSWYLKFNGVRAPRGFQRPEVAHTSASGTVTTRRQLMLPLVQGTWYLDTDGYARYHTAAVFPLAVEFAADLAHDILLDTLATLAERGATP